MVGYLDNKSTLNLNAAKMLHDNSIYCSSVHCSYYSCVQKIISKLLTLYTEDELAEDKRNNFAQQSMHQYYLKRIVKDIKINIKNISRQDLTKFTNDLSKLKELRENSDYKNADIPSDCSTKAYLLAQEIQSFIKEIL